MRIVASPLVPHGWPMLAYVALKTSDGRTHVLKPGDVVGRLATAACTIADPRIHEAHAMVSMRGKALKLMALVDPIAVRGRSVPDVALVPDLEVTLAPGCVLGVVEVGLPRFVLGLEGPGLARQPLDGTSSLVTRPRPSLVRGVAEQAAAVFWGHDGTWQIQIVGAARRALGSDDALAIDGLAYRTVAIPIEAAALSDTPVDARLVRLVLSFDTVQVHEHDHMALLNGSAARLVSELWDMGGVAAWEILATRLATQSVPRDRLRARLDKALALTRRQLAASGIRRDLVRATRAGVVVLAVTERDRIEDRL